MWNLLVLAALAIGSVAPTACGPAFSSIPSSRPEKPPENSEKKPDHDDSEEDNDQNSEDGNQEEDTGGPPTVYELLEMETNYAIEACRSLALRDNVSISSKAGIPGMRENSGLAGSVAAPLLSIEDGVEIEGEAAGVSDACKLPALTFIQSRIADARKTVHHGSVQVDTALLLNGTAHHFEELSLTGHGRLRVTEPTYITAEIVRLAGHAAMADYPTDVRLYAKHVIIGDEASFQGRIIADRVELSGDSQVTGTILANEVLAGDRAQVYYATLLAEAGFYYSCREYTRVDMNLHRVYLLPDVNLAPEAITQAAHALRIKDIKAYRGGLIGLVEEPADYQGLLASTAFRWVGHFLYSATNRFLGNGNEVFIGFHGPQDDEALIHFTTTYPDSQLSFVARMDETSMFATTSARMTPELLGISNGLCDNPHVFSSHPDVLPLP